jgi:hypothetical protein
VNVSAYDARVAWTYGSHGDEPYPGKIRSLAAFCADTAALYSYRARRFSGLPTLLADLLAAALWAVFPVLSDTATLITPPAPLEARPAGWTLRPSDRFPARRTTGPPCVPTSANTPEAAPVISP